MPRKEQIYATDAMRRALQDSITALNLVIADSPSRQHAVQALKSCDKALKLIDKVPTDTIYLKTGEAARYLGISQRSVQLACEQGQLPYSLTPTGGHRRIKQEDLIAFKETFGIAPSVRIVWDINGKKGHGAWHNISRKQSLLDSLETLQAKFGPGTYAIEERDPRVVGKRGKPTKVIHGTQVAPHQVLDANNNTTPA